MKLKFNDPKESPANLRVSIRNELQLFYGSSKFSQIFLAVHTQYVFTSAYSRNVTYRDAIVMEEST